MQSFKNFLLNEVDPMPQGPPPMGGDPMMGGGMPPGPDPMMGGGMPPGMPPMGGDPMMGGGMPPGMPGMGGGGGSGQKPVKIVDLDVWSVLDAILSHKKIPTPEVSPKFNSGQQDSPMMPPDNQMLPGNQPSPLMGN